ncbi:Tyrosine-specific transport protein [Camellia lanceoleosa]|uniref:Tyrosine-specific transport protein n=1 Tax=Camellia lanceoleosa TaxID=1840588 RepID=A0ACC0F2E6_9ERIC|nr:Tyrosine-specific transport protein [Camellia lanceoleosa]
MAMACSSSSSTCSIFSPDMQILSVPLLSKPIKKFNHIHHHHHHQDERTVAGVGRPLLLYRRFQKNPSSSSSSSSPTSLSVKCFSHRQSTQQEEKDEEFQLERLFSNLNQVTLKREPGSLSSAILLVSGTTVGAGILAIPAVTQESGFLASAVTCIVCWVFMVVTGLLIAEVNVKTMCELGSGGVSLVSMAMRTLGTAGVQIACWSYIFIHNALLVAYVDRSSDILTNFLGIPLWESTTLFSLLFGGICFFGSQRFIGAINGVLVFGIITSFTALVVVASSDLHWDALLKANFGAVPASIPIIALSFVYQNVVPVICTNLEGNLSKVRTAIVLGTAIPLALFVVWNAVILGSITSFEIGSDKIIDPLQQLQSANQVVGPIVDVFSLLAIATSYIGFVLGLADFLADFYRSDDSSHPCHVGPLQWFRAALQPSTRSSKIQKVGASSSLPIYR